MIHYCTYFDRNFLARAIALHRSLIRHGPAFTLWALCLDDATVEALETLQLEGVRAVPLAELEQADPELLAVKGSRSTVEYYFTCSPSLPRYLLDRHPEIEMITYLDADLFFYSSPTPIFEELGEGSVLIIPHRYPERLRHLEIYGVYNVGLLTFRNDRRARAVLDRWREQCLDWCYDRVDDGRFADQGYLDGWPGKPGVVVSQNPGAGVGPWNLGRYQLDLMAAPPLADGYPIAFVHFQGLKELRSGVWNTAPRDYAVRDRTVRRRLYRPYIRQLQAAARAIEASGAPGSAEIAGLRFGRMPWWRVAEKILRGSVIYARAGRTPDREEPPTPGR